MIRRGFFSAAALVSALYAPHAGAQAPGKAGAGLNSIAADARERGMKGCVPTLNRLTNQIIGNTRYGAYPVASGTETKDRLYTVVISRQLDGGVTQLVSLSVSPDKNCSLSYDIHTVWPAACDQVAARNFPSYQQLTPMSGTAVMRQEHPFKQVYLVPLPGGCMSMRKDTVFSPGAGS
jgi:hypothetical protein